MTKIEFKQTHRFDDQQMSEIDHLRAIFGTKKPCVVINQDEGRWVHEVIENRGKNGKN